MAEQQEKYSDSDRYEIARELVEEIVPTLDELYDRIRTYENTGDLPALLERDIKKQIIELMNKRNSLKSRISRIKRMMKKDGLSNTEKGKLEKELLEKEVVLQGVEGELFNAG